MRRGIGRLRAGGGVSYVGPVATGLYFPTNFYTTGSLVGLNTQAPHWATSDISSMQLVFVNTAADGTTEHTVTAKALFLSVTIEYPAGTFTRVKLSGASTIPLAIGGYIVTDPVAVNIPSGSKFMVAVNWTAQDGSQPFVPGTYNVGCSLFFQNCFGTNTDTSGTFSKLGSSYVTDITYRFGPQAIIAQTTKRTFALIGDSRTEGVQDGITDTNKACTGEIARVVQSYGTINLGIGNDKAVNYVASHAQRNLLAAYCSDVVLGFGANDVFSRTAPQLLADTQTIMGYFPNARKYLYTLPPVGVSSTDSYATLANQTVNATANPPRLAYNALLRAGVTGAARIWEVADVLESSRDSGKWRVDLGLVNGNTAAGDATHENALGNSTIANSGAVSI